MRDITSANASAYLQNDLFPAGLKFERFSADGAWTQDNYETKEHRIGVDGNMVAGYTPTEKEITFTFEANSPTLDGLDLIWQKEQIDYKPIWSEIVITIPSIKKVISLSNVLLTSYKLIPNAEKVLAPRDATFVCDKIVVDDL